MSNKNWWESMREDALRGGLLALLLLLALIGFVLWLIEQIVTAVLQVILILVVLALCILGAFLLWVLLYYLWKLAVLEWSMQEEMDSARKKIARQERLIRSVEDQIATLSPADQQAAQPRLQELKDERDWLVERLSEKAHAWADYVAQKLDSKIASRQKVLGQLGRMSQAKLERKLAESDARINKLKAKLDAICLEYDVQPDPPELRWQRMFPALDRVASWIAAWRAASRPADKIVPTVTENGPAEPDINGTSND